VNAVGAAASVRRVLVTGGSGFVGRALCEKLARRDPGGCITVPTRFPMRAAALRTLPTLDLVAADIVGDDAALARVVAGQDAVVHLVAVLHGDEARFQRLHVELPRRLAAACAAAGVRRLVHISALGVGPDAPSMYLRSKTAGEALLRASGLDVTVLRPSVIFGARDKLLNTFASLQALFPVVPLAAADAQFQPVWVEDVAEAIVRCLDRPGTAGQVFECAGPDVMTLREIVQAAGRYAGHERPVLPLPPAIARVQAALMSLAPGEPLLSRDNLDSMTVPNVATGTLPGLAALGITPASLHQIAPGYLGGDDGCARYGPLRARARRH
jgi:uncharacterized protein YbjT (DUF2867 family)